MGKYEMVPEPMLEHEDEHYPYQVSHRGGIGEMHCPYCKAPVTWMALHLKDCSKVDNKD